MLGVPPTSLIEPIVAGEETFLSGEHEPNVTAWDGLSQYNAPKLAALNWLRMIYCAPRLFLLIQSVLILRHCDTFVTNFTSAKFRALYSTRRIEELYSVVIIKNLSAKIGSVIDQTNLPLRFSRRIKRTTVK
ncbi:hypothetical protein EVAR_8386_1 [Eumeta japonica]|uniref:Uncharacterized protein n=1 Tax=Eumeta variegata TaxID=151549 RepID=A0A4C1VCH4_EUMVA|nr:hypothetical protein EVAR_8386_1 [Eumeta japonica]